MRITLTIPTSATQAPPQRKTDPPLVQLAGTGERVLIELQGELGYEGDPCGRVVGLLSFERMVSLPFFPFASVVLPLFGQAGSGRCWALVAYRRMLDASRIPPHVLRRRFSIHASFSHPRDLPSSYSYPDTLVTCLRLQSFSHSTHSVSQADNTSSCRTSQPYISANTIFFTGKSSPFHVRYALPVESSRSWHPRTRKKRSTSRIPKRLHQNVQRRTSPRRQKFPAHHPSNEHPPFPPT